MNFIVLFLFTLTQKIKKEEYKSDFMLEGILASMLFTCTITINLITRTTFGKELGVWFYFLLYLITIITGGWVYSNSNRFERIIKKRSNQKVLIGGILTLILFLAVLSPIIL